MKRKDRKRREEDASAQPIPRDLRQLMGEEEEDDLDDEDFYQAKRDSGVRRHRGRRRDDKQTEGGFGG